MDLAFLFFLHSCCLKALIRKFKKKRFWVFATIFLLALSRSMWSRGSWVAIAVGVCFSIVTLIVTDRRNAANALLVLAVLFCVGYIVLTLSPTISKSGQ